mmetsp:Transcript_11136/g.16137  ORF Transcript_11136/g.16137 Transcript_11136/m.16137 type:complete len:101 (+) Transcript_11136:1411-1713(+)
MVQVAIVPDAPYAPDDGGAAHEPTECTKNEDMISPTLKPSSINFDILSVFLGLEQRMSQMINDDPATERRAVNLGGITSSFDMVMVTILLRKLLAGFVSL